MLQGTWLLSWSIDLLRCFLETPFSWNKKKQSLKQKISKKNTVCSRKVAFFLLHTAKNNATKYVHFSLLYRICFASPAEWLVWEVSCLAFVIIMTIMHNIIELKANDYTVQIIDVNFINDFRCGNNRRRPSIPLTRSRHMRRDNSFFIFASFLDL